jgi:hypothetical protein
MERKGMNMEKYSEEFIAIIVKAVLHELDKREADVARRSKLTILLDENLEPLKDGLRDSGFKVISVKKGMPDEEIKELAEGTVILTKNSKDFVNDAVRFDYDIVAIENIKFIDTDKTRKNQTVEKVSNAIRESDFASKRGNFLLTIEDTGHYRIKSLT